jgi:Uma2 family endonuclease
MIDRREKLMAYRKLASLREYVILAQDKVSAEVFRRSGDGAWLSGLVGPGENLCVASVGVTFPLASLYEGVELGVQ